MNRLEEELDLLQHRFDSLEFRAEGQWVRVPEYSIPATLWKPSIVQLAFQIPPDPAAAPYAFHVRPLNGAGSLELLAGEPIGNYTYPTITPWGNDWGTFSWTLEAWTPRVPITDGTTMLDFARSFAGRFGEGA